MKALISPNVSAQPTVTSTSTPVSTTLRNACAKSKSKAVDEFALIRRYFDRAIQATGVRTGIGDDGDVVPFGQGLAGEGLDIIRDLFQGIAPDDAALLEDSIIDLIRSGQPFCKLGIILFCSAVLLKRPITLERFLTYI